jgi:hypothetical protein
MIADITLFVGGAVGCNSWPYILLWTPHRAQRLVRKFATAKKDFVNKQNRSHESAFAENS